MHRRQWAVIFFFGQMAFYSFIFLFIFISVQSICSSCKKAPQRGMQVLH